ncbi:MAG: enoyl-CoA hydratase/isomerase family protein [Candidatus Korarchaeota archaeon]|nr:enoyl-CoA hydratase/isomerase family protein [Thermoproteota archaeon]
MDYETIIYEKRENIAIIALNRPEVLNALNFKMIDEIVDAIKKVSKDDEVRVLVIKGVGRAFCVGDDLKGMQKPGESPPGSALEIEDYLRRGYVRVVKALRGLMKPTIACIHGYALGAGLDLALACDFRIASETARFGAPYVLRGLVGGTVLLPRIVGLAKATELLFLGDIIDAKKAEQIGLVNKVVPEEDLEKMTMELATKLTKISTIAIGLTKRAVEQGLGADLDRAVDYQISAALLSMQSEDFQEGVSAFIERREPRFKGRMAIKAPFY